MTTGSWVRRLLGLGSPQAAPGPASAPAPMGAKAPAAAARAAAAPALFGKRSPLVDGKGRVAGFELKLPLALELRFAGQPDAPQAAAHHLALLASAGSLARSGLTPVVPMPSGLLTRERMAEAVPAGVWLLLDRHAELPPPVAAALRGRGVKLGSWDGPPRRDPTIDFVAARAAAGGIDTLQMSAQRWSEALPKVRMVALDVQSLSDMELVIRSGYSLAGGRLSRDGPAQNPRPLGAAAHRICELINHLALDRDTALISHAVQGDAVLSYRLLRYANSPAIGLAQPVEAIEAAVAILGRAELGRWLSVMLLSAASGRQAAAAVQSQALASGRMFELLARDKGESAPEVLFTLGLLSQLHLLLELPMHAALEPLRLSEPLRQALLERSGPWAVYLELAAELEGDDEVTADRVAAPFGGLAAVMQRAETAWDWARGVTGSLGTD